MKRYKKTQISKALTKKGFQEFSSRHVKFALFVDSKAVGIHTVISHGSGEPGENLLHQMKKELKFENQRDFEDFIDCTYSYERYVENLKNRGLIR